VRYSTFATVARRRATRPSACGFGRASTYSAISENAGVDARLQLGYEVVELFVLFSGAEPDADDARERQQTEFDRFLRCDQFGWDVHVNSLE
jgi:hypothetical protein